MDPLIVVGYDGSTHGHAALRWAVDEARLRHARLRVVHAWQLVYVEGYPYTGPLADPDGAGTSAKQMVADAVADATAGAEADIEVEQVVLCGTPASALLEHSKDADLLVVGSRGHGGFAGLLLGSVSNQVTHHATCPVVVVRTESGGTHHA
jgi:nucleotide-binding universal stress UspA family protein